MKNLTARSLFRFFVFLSIVLCLHGAASAQLFSYRFVDQIVNDIAYSRSTGMIYASVPSVGGQYGNKIVVVDPRSGLIVNNAFAGSEPNRLSLTSDGNYLYVAMDGSSSVKRFVLSSMTSDISFSLGSSSNGPLLAEDLAAIPGRPNMVAVSRRNTCCSPRHEGVAIYVDGVKVPNTTDQFSEANELEASSDPNILYGYNNETSGFEYRQLTIDSSGVTITASHPSPFGFAYSIEVRYAGGRAYSSNGKVIDAVTAEPLGAFSLSGSPNGLTVDTVNRRAFFVTGSTLLAYSTTTFQPVGAVTLPTFVFGKARLIRWGRRGIAYRTDEGKLAIAETLLVTQKSSQ
ncbi:MAG TPA: hypothetical protein PKC65_04705 [Pyrinomonadaceae bacterium]|nr:hypothetical protein [Pyrinomonadaceae bacterium]